MTQQIPRSQSLPLLVAAACTVVVTGVAGASLLEGFLVSRSTSVTVSECNDGIDNDGDGRRDRADPSCLWGTSEGRQSVRSVLLRRRAVLTGGQSQTLLPVRSAVDVDHAAAGTAPADAAQHSSVPRTFRIPWMRLFYHQQSSSAPAVPTGAVDASRGAPCADHVDNDMDGMTDGADPDCACSGGATESGTCHGAAPECSDGIDNDVDGMTDGADPGCACAKSESATCPSPAAGACSDHTDNDSDGMTDGADPDCACSGGATETACGTGTSTPAAVSAPAAQ